MTLVGKTDLWMALFLGALLSFQIGRIQVSRPAVFHISKTSSNLPSILCIGFSYEEFDIVTWRFLGQESSLRHLLVLMGRKVLHMGPTCHPMKSHPGAMRLLGQNQPLG